jgi:putative phage-type endonuclease
MRKLDLEQGTTAWLNWRRGLITATDAAKLLSLSPYETPYKCWQKKVGLIGEDRRTEAMERGLRDEPIAREIFNHRYHMSMQPTLIESEKYNFLGASLDGISSCNRFIMEVKSNNAEFHECAYKGIIPDFHKVQIQHQLLSSDGVAEKAFYVSYNSGEIAVVEVLPDLSWQSMYLEKAREFWKRIVLFDPPPLTNKDYKEKHDIPAWNRCAEEYRSICSDIKSLEERKDALRKELIELANDESSIGNGVRVIKKLVKGRVDYDSIPEIQNLDLEKYRKPSSINWCITVDTK